MKRVGAGHSDQTESASGKEVVNVQHNVIKRTQAIGPSSPFARLEVLFYIGVWVGHSIYAWYLVWKASDAFEPELWNGYFERGWTLLSGRRRDFGIRDWNSWHKSLPWELKNFLVHAICMFILERVFQDRAKFEKAMSVVWTCQVFGTYGRMGIATTFGFGALMLLSARIWRRPAAVWLCACGLLWILNNYWHQLDRNGDLPPYLGYKILHYISFCLYDIEVETGKSIKGSGGEKERKVSPLRSGMTAYCALMRYTLYYPYAQYLIVAYRDYLIQWRNRRSTKPDYLRAIVVAARVGFWVILNDFVLHFFHVNALLSDEDVLRKMNLPTLLAAGYTACQFFQMAYVCIFGLNTVFAVLDGMTPPLWPPMCASLMSLNSDIWRGFDRGLHAFLREHLFVPICKPTLSFLRRFSASLFCFAFVWYWHGMSTDLFIWTSMNFFVITMENFVKMFYRVPFVYKFFNQRLTPVANRRCQAMMQALCPVWDILSLVYFFTGRSSGDAWKSQLLTHMGPFSILYMGALGYAIAQCSIEFEYR